LGLAAGGALGCAEERAPINRVQPDALAKSFFVGNDLVDTSDDPEFYAQGTIADVGYGAAQDGLFTSSYAQPITRVKWEIREDQLIGRITYERIADSDHKGVGAASKDGQVAYVYPIRSHFDIRRDYNPSTGEESNVIVENTSDRPWYERQYMRVDWSQNLAKDGYDFDTLSMLGLFGGVSYEPLAYYVNNPDDPDAPHFNPKAGYFDVTNKAFAQPGMIDLSGMGWGINKFPSCFLENDFFGGSAPSGNCNPVEITIRQSFKRVEKSDYEPVEWDGYKFQAFGIFTTERRGYSRNYGMTDQLWHRMASRYNIWEKSHAYQPMTGPSTCPDGWAPSADYPDQCEVQCNVPSKTGYGGDPTVDSDGDGTADECASVTEKFGGGSKCDTFKQKCTLPYAQRKEVPIVWHISKGSNPEFVEGTQWATQEWDVAMRLAVQAARYAECEATGNDAATCQGQYPIFTGQEQENLDAVQLATEMDNCRASGQSEDACGGVVDGIAAQRGYSDGVKAIAKMQEMVVLCHSPVIATDSKLCVQDIQAKDPIDGDTRAVLPKEVTDAMCDAVWYPADPGAKIDEAVKAKCDNGFFIRYGDMRFHQVTLIKEPQTPSPWGIMVDADDPLTGEKVHASINIWTHVNDLASQQLLDVARYIKGELTTADVTDGTYVKDWALAAEAAGGGSLGTMTKDMFTQRIQGAANASHIAGEKFDLKNSPKVPADALARAAELRREMQGVRADARATTTSAPIYAARRSAAMDTQTEAGLMTEPMLELGDVAGPGADALPPEFKMQNASVLRGADPHIQMEFRRMKELALADRGACILNDAPTAPAPNNLVGITDVLERKFGKFNPNDDKATQFARQEAMRKFVAQRYQYGVIIHEMGHSIGLRHNFVTSANAWGYNPQYWQLRTNDGKLTQECTDASTQGGKDCVGPRYFDPVTDNEKKNLIWMFMQSSVMDYPGEVTQDMKGLGGYDFAAARMFYGQVTSVFTDPSYGAGKPRSKALVSDIMDNFGGIVGIQFHDASQQQPLLGGSKLIHYSQIQKVYEQIKNCRTINPDDFKPTWWNDDFAAKYGQWDPLLDSLIVQQENGSYTRCDEQPVDYVPYDSLRYPNKAEIDGGSYRGSPAIDKQKRTRVPYAFATDDWADLGNLSVYRHDNGADPYELFDFFITEQETRHIFDNYRRNRNSFSVKAASTRILERYNTKMRDAAKGLTLQYNFFKDLMASGQFFTNGQPVDIDAGWWAALSYNLWPDTLLASGIAFDHFARQIMRPESGPHFEQQYFSSSANEKVWRADDFNATDPVIVPNGATGLFGQVSYGGKPMENALADNKGEYDRDFVLDAGAYYDKVYAPMLLTESVDNFISSSRSDFVDARYRAVSVADLFPDAYRRLIGNALTGDEYIKGPAVMATAGGTPMVDADKFPTNGVGWTTWITDQPQDCFPGKTGIMCGTFGCSPGKVCTTDGSGNLITHSLDNDQLGSNTIAVLDPEVNWEQWKFLIAQTLLYLPENQKQNWINQLGIWEIGSDTDPAFQNRIELHLPDGRVFVAQTYGTEVIRGQTVQRGIGARILEWANVLMNKAYECTPVLSPDGVTTWYEPIFVAGKPVVKFDGFQPLTTNPSCSAPGTGPGYATEIGCTCSSNRACVELEKYQSVPVFLRQSLHDFRMADATMKGIYE
jgi:hypothetical protein